jgi:hypothetical protein
LTKLHFERGLHQQLNIPRREEIISRALIQQLYQPWHEQFPQLKMRNWLSKEVSDLEMLLPVESEEEADAVE